MRMIVKCIVLFISAVCFSIHINAQDTAKKKTRLKKITVSVLHSPADYEPEDTTGIFRKVEIEAQFPGKDGFRKFVAENFRANKATMQKAPAGTYTIETAFVVTKDGTLSDIISISKPVGYGMEDEVKRLLLISPRWIPAKQNGRIIGAYRRITVIVNVAEE
jgi:hypothetical protein